MKIFGISAAVLLLLYAVVGTRLGSDFSFRRLIVYLSGVLVIGFVLTVEKGLERLWPDGERRHRILGRFTMVIYCILFLTGTGTYTLLYILYPGKIG